VLTVFNCSSGAFGDEYTLRAIVELYGVTVEIISSLPGPGYDVSITPASGDVRGTITLTHYDSELAPHYNLALSSQPGTCDVDVSVVQPASKRRCITGAPSVLGKPVGVVHPQRLDDPIRPGRLSLSPSLIPLACERAALYSRMRAPEETSPIRTQDGDDAPRLRLQDIIVDSPALPDHSQVSGQCDTSPPRVPVALLDVSVVQPAPKRRCFTGAHPMLGEPAGVVHPQRLDDPIRPGSPSMSPSLIPLACDRAPFTCPLPFPEPASPIRTQDGDDALRLRLQDPIIDSPVLLDLPQVPGKCDTSPPLVPAPTQASYSHTQGSAPISPVSARSAADGVPDDDCDDNSSAPLPAPTPASSSAAAAKKRLRKGKSRLMLQNLHRSSNSSGSLLTTKAESWMSISPRTLQELSCTVSAGGSVLRDAMNSDSVTVNWAEHAAFYRKLTASSMTAVVKTRMVIRDLARHAALLVSIPAPRLNEAVGCTSFCDLEMSLSSCGLTLLMIDHLWDVIRDFKRAQDTLVDQGNLKWGEMSASSVVNELPGIVVQGLLKAVTPSGANSGDKSRMISVCNADPECPYHCQHNLHTKLGHWCFLPDRYIHHTCEYDSAFLGSVFAAQTNRSSKLAMSNKLRKMQEQDQLRPNTPAIISKMNVILQAIAELDADALLHATVSPVMLGIRHVAPYLAIHLAPTLKCFFPKPGSKPPSEPVVRAHIANYTSYPVSKDFVQQVRDCAKLFFERPVKECDAQISKLVQAIRNCGHVATIQTVSEEQAWELLVEARQSQVKHATPTGRPVKVITKHDVQKPAPGIYVTSVSWAPKQSQPFAVIPGTREPCCPSTISHDGAHMRNRHCPGTLMSSVRLDSNRNIQMVAMGIYVRAECTPVWEDHYRTVLKVAPEASGRYLLDVRNNQMCIHSDDSLPGHHVRVAVVLIHDHDKGCNKADKTVLHRYPDVGNAIRVFMDPPHLCRNVVKVGKKGQAKAAMAVCMCTDKVAADAMHAKLDPKVKAYLLKTSANDKARFMVSHQLLAGPMDGTYTSNASEVFQRMCESIRSAASMQVALGLSLVLEKKRREEAVAPVAKCAAGERFPPRVSRLLRERRVAFDKYYSPPYSKYVTLPFVGCTSEGLVASSSGKVRHKVRVWQPQHSKSADVKFMECWSSNCSCAREPNPCFHVMCYCFATQVCDPQLLVKFSSTVNAWALTHPPGYVFPIPGSNWTETDDTEVLDEIRLRHNMAPGAPVVLMVLNKMKVGRGRPKEVSLSESNHILFGSSNVDRDAIKNLDLMTDLPVHTQEFFEPEDEVQDDMSAGELQHLAQAYGYDLGTSEDLDPRDAAFIDPDVQLPVSAPVIELGVLPVTKSYFDLLPALLSESLCVALRRSVLTRWLKQCDLLLSQSWPAFVLQDLVHPVQVLRQVEVLESVTDTICALEHDCHMELVNIDPSTAPFNCAGTFGWGSHLASSVKLLWGAALVRRHILSIYHRCFAGIVITTTQQARVDNIVNKAAVLCSDCTLVSCRALVVTRGPADVSHMPAVSLQALSALSVCSAELALELCLHRPNAVPPTVDIRVDAFLSTGSALPFAQLQYMGRNMSASSFIWPESNRLLCQPFFVQSMLSALQEMQVEAFIELCNSHKRDTTIDKSLYEWAVHRNTRQRGAENVPFVAAQRVFDDACLCDYTMQSYSHLICHMSHSRMNLPKCATPTNTFFHKDLSAGDTGYTYTDIYTAHIDLARVDLVLIPVHLPSAHHWVTLVMDLAHRECRFYDSLGGNTPTGGTQVSYEITSRCMRWLQEKTSRENDSEVKLRLETRLGDFATWHHFYNGYLYSFTCNGRRKNLAKHHALVSVPQQTNGTDCGVCALKFMQREALGVSVDAGFDTGRVAMVNFRRRMVLEILEGELHCSVHH
jgi:hypothetical protein